MRISVKHYLLMTILMGNQEASIHRRPAYNDRPLAEIMSLSQAAIERTSG